MEESQLYPCFYPCTNKSEFDILDTQACELLDFPNAGALDYCNPIIDNFGVYWFTVNPEVNSLVDLTKCVPYDEIVLPPSPPLQS